MSTPPLRSSAWKILNVIKNGYQAFILYFVILIVSSCVMTVATAGPMKIKYYDASTWYFYQNFTTFPKTMYTMYITHTTANYPDNMLLKWKDHSTAVVGTLISTYIGFMNFIVMNIMVGVFYSNYKSQFSEMISGLKDQKKLANIVKAATSKNGNIKVPLVREFLHKLYNDDDSSDFDIFLKEES